ncbi:hypothetical protein [Ramlibacter rhizophilus]|uniref:Uncharacterized protein n=1 Tax=Ramlibacter rhizophilus TaxID=1781167 RepID=A0A4Z0C2I2_9BURK|nr:hypothetical protein [Ramlibacter rhizophilus]TFZ04419.1 hypothetical protein EZ242_01305 [Ramlibacter rhizophilus]
MGFVIVGAWTLFSLAVLVSFLPVAGDALPGGELGMLMYVASFPSSILVGIGLNQSEFGSMSQTGFSNAFAVWLPFFAAGLLQWAIIGAAVERCRSKR